MVNIPDSDLIALHNNQNNIIFIGKMSYEPNIVAVTYFATKIFPIVKLEFPNIKFIIVGANPDKRIKKLARIDGVRITGYVDSLETYFKESTIVVAPMLTGAGIQNKIIQAMSYGCCVATTTIGAEGLEINNGEIGIFNSTEEWIKGLSELLKNRKQRVDMGKLARQYVIDKLSPNIISKQFWNFIRSGGIDVFLDLKNSTGDAAFSIS